MGFVVVFMIMGTEVFAKECDKPIKIEKVDEKIELNVNREKGFSYGVVTQNDGII